MGNSNPGSASVGRDWLLGNRYTRISLEGNFLGANLMRGTRILGPFVSKLIDRLRTNEKRVREEQAFLRYLDAGNSNFRPADRGD